MQIDVDGYQWIHVEKMPGQIENTEKRETDTNASTAVPNKENEQLMKQKSASNRNK